MISKKSNYEPNFDFDDSLGVYVPNGAPKINADDYNEDQNCYTLSLAIPDHGYGHPGSLLRQQIQPVSSSELTREWLDKALDKDGLVSVDADIVDDPVLGLKGHFIAVFIRDIVDCHFAVKGNDGVWYDKLFDNPVRALGRFKLEDLHVDYYHRIGVREVPSSGLTYAKKIIS